MSILHSIIWAPIPTNLAMSSISKEFHWCWTVVWTWTLLFTSYHCHLCPVKGLATCPLGCQEMAQISCSWMAWVELCYGQLICDLLVTVLSQELKECGNRVFVDGPIELLPPQMNVVDISTIDTILLSNHSCMLALPFITEDTEFKGRVYATEPTLQIGRYTKAIFFILRMFSFSGSI